MIFPLTAAVDPSVHGCPRWSRENRSEKVPRRQAVRTIAQVEHSLVKGTPIGVYRDFCSKRNACVDPVLILCHPTSVHPPTTRITNGEV